MCVYSLFRGGRTHLRTEQDFDGLCDPRGSNLCRDVSSGVPREKNKSTMSDWKTSLLCSVVFNQVILLCALNLQIYFPKKSINQFHVHWPRLFLSFDCCQWNGKSWPQEILGKQQFTYATIQYIFRYEEHAFDSIQFIQCGKRQKQVLFF